ncbi:MAG: ATP-dependent Clp protease ATP-binding subunit, partial [Bacteroidota bacterium]|nr:ATP-dependent Clp protease ATP-binding subunit [Bacteroidota bacterium]
DVPQEIVDLEEKLESVRGKKNSVVKKQKYEEAAKLRDDEKRIEKELFLAQEEWQETQKENRVTVNESDIADVVSMMTGIPVNRVAESESIRLNNLAVQIKEKIIGQDQVVEKVVRAIQRNRAGLKNPKKPIGSFIFLGQTGVGKTQLAKVLTTTLFDTPDALIRLDMSEYMEKFTISRLIGAPPGYVGYEEGGQLTEKVRRKPYAVVLLDEIEKAHPDVFNMLLQILDDGFITDSLGRRVDFRNTIIIMTSNIGARQVKDFGLGVGFGTAAIKAQADDHTKSVIKNALKKTFAPEFLNRIDDVVIFNSLEKSHIAKIIKIELRDLESRIQELGFSLSLTKKAIEFLNDKGFDVAFGARPLSRAIQKYIEDVLAEEIMKNKIPEGAMLQFDWDGKSENLSFSLSYEKNTAKS